MPSRHASGMSLVEVLVVIVLVAAITGTLAVGMGVGSDGRQLRGAVREVVAQLRHARSQAVLQGQDAAFALDMQERRWISPGGKSGRLPAALDVRAVVAEEAAEDENDARIVFHPDGSSTGGVIRLSQGDAEWRIEVLWLTGKVRAERMREPGE